MNTKDMLYQLEKQEQEEKIKDVEEFKNSPRDISNNATMLQISSEAKNVLLEAKNEIEGYYLKNTKQERRIVGSEPKVIGVTLINKIEVIGVKNWSDCTDPIVIFKCINFDYTGPINERIISIAWNDRCKNKVSEEFGNKIQMGLLI